MKTNNELLLDLKKSIEEATSQYMYKFDSETKKPKMRKPNNKELKRWLKTVLQAHYCFYTDHVHGLQDPMYPISRATYYSLKGMICHGNFVPVLTYLKRRGHPNVMDNFYEYANTPSITDVKVKFSNPRARASVCTIEIKLHG